MWGFDKSYIHRWAHWDGGHFIAIAQENYIPIQYAFMPLYPVLMYLMTIFSISAFWAGMIISHLATYLFLYYLYKITALDFSEDVAKKVILVALAFPTSFYLGAVYSEALFLGLSVGALYYARIKNWRLAFLLASLTPLARMVGVGVIVAVAFEYLFSHIPTWQPKQILKNLYFRVIIFLFGIYTINQAIVRIKTTEYFIIGLIQTTTNLLGICLQLITPVVLAFYLVRYLSIKSLKRAPLTLIMTLPLAFYCFYLYQIQGDPLAFIHQHSNWQRTPTLPLQTLSQNLLELLKPSTWQVIHTHNIIELSSFLIFVIILIYSFFKMRYSYTIYLAFIFLLPLSSGTLMSMPRLLLAAFPLMIAVAQIKNSYIYQSILLFSILFLGLLSVLYINAFWVA